MAINVSARTLHRPGMEDEILDQLRQAGLPCDRLVVEVTEGVQIQDDEVGLRLQRLRAHGVRVALDDFGTGWSSLSYLRRFPVDILKLDRSFTSELGEGADATAIPAAVVQLAAALGLDTVAEGVETRPSVQRSSTSASTSHRATSTPPHYPAPTSTNASAGPPGTSPGHSISAPTVSD